jgi:hypothetical protein
MRTATNLHPPLVSEYLLPFCALRTLQLHERCLVSSSEAKKYSKESPSTLDIATQKVATNNNRILSAWLTW